jgi:hypothetical protein
MKTEAFGGKSQDKRREEKSRLFNTHTTLATMKTQTCRGGTTGEK